jgi:hypothetical protein
MEPEFPGIAVGLHHLGLARHVIVVVVANVALAHEGLEVRAELNAVGRVHVDHLHLPAQALVVEQRVHHRQRVAEDQPVDPLVAMLIGAKHLVGDRMLRVGEQLKLHLRVAPMALEGFDYRLGGKPLMN